MNHFLDENKQQNLQLTEDLIKANPLNDVKPSVYRLDVAKQARQNAQQRVITNDTQKRFQE
jgi:hypothetical protein